MTEVSDSLTPQHLHDIQWALKLGVKPRQPYLTFYHGLILKVAFLLWDQRQIILWTPQTDLDRRSAMDARETEKHDPRFAVPKEHFMDQFDDVETEYFGFSWDIGQ